MKEDFYKHIDRDGIYTGARVIALTGIAERTFYRYVQQGKIPKHELEINGKAVFLGHEILSAFSQLKKPLVYFVKPHRGRPKKNG